MASPFIGLKNFDFVFESSFWKMAGRTVLYSFTLMLFSFPVSLVLALLINEIRNEVFKKVVQTLTYIPHFVSWVTVAGLFYLFLSTDRSGLVNNILELFGKERYSYMQDARFFLPFLVISQTWKEVGWGTIIYLASLAAIDPQMYEAATVDGAGRWKCTLHITIPEISVTIGIMFIMAVGGMLNAGYDQILLLQQPANNQISQVLDTYIIQTGIRYGKFEYATAIGLFKSVFSLIMVAGTNYLTQKYAEVGLW